MCVLVVQEGHWDALGHCCRTVEFSPPSFFSLPLWRTTITHATRTAATTTANTQIMDPPHAFIETEQVADKNGDGRMNYEEFLEMMTENTVSGGRGRREGREAGTGGDLAACIL